MLRFALVVVTLSLAGPTLAERLPPPDQKDIRLRPRLSPAERERLEHEVRQKAHTLVVVELSARLGLDEATALKLADALRGHHEQRRAFRQKMRAEHQALARLLGEGASDEALRAQTAKVLAAADEKPSLEDLARETAKFLTPTQQAKLVLALPDVMREVRHMMRRARRGGPSSK